MPQATNPATHHPLSLTLEERLADLPKDKTIVAYCRGAYCILSFDAVKSLREKGYNARRLADGIPGWLVANLKLVKPK
ncbi:MAG: rhodanese-like domain-containing protein [Burkholderiaceae bacterium]